MPTHHKSCDRFSHHNCCEPRKCFPRLTSSSSSRSQSWSNYHLSTVFGATSFLRMQTIERYNEIKLSPKPMICDSFRSLCLRFDSNCMWESEKLSPWRIRTPCRGIGHDEEWAERRSKKLFTIHWKSILNHYCRKARRKTQTRGENLFLLFFPVYLLVLHTQHNGKCLSRQFCPLR
jgi:hypothetical protein